MKEIKNKPRRWIGWRWLLLLAALMLGLGELGIYIGGVRRDPDWARLTWISGMNIVGYVIWVLLYRRFGLRATQS